MNDGIDNVLKDRKKQLLVVLTGAGISAESGIPTFRDANGLWEGHNIYEVAHPEGWRKNPELVLRFYNLRRKGAAEVQPNEGHYALARLQDKFNVVIVTQNVDDLHERAGSQYVIHLHGELKKVRSTLDPTLIYDVGDKEINLGDKCERGSQLRPHIVWFEEAVPMMGFAEEVAELADYFAVVGTSLAVYPAANLIHSAPANCPKYIIDRKLPPIGKMANLTCIEEPATIGVPKLEQILNNLA